MADKNNGVALTEPMLPEKIKVKETELGANVKKLTDRANAIKITDQKSYEQASAILVEAKNGWKAVTDFFEEEIDLANKMHKLLTGKRSFFRDPYKTIEDTLKPRITKYLDDQEKARLAEENKLRLAAEEKERAAKQKLADEAEELRKKAAAAAESGDTKAAAKLEEKAAAKEEKIDEVVVNAPSVMTQAPKVAGQSTTTKWKAEVIDKKLIPLEYLVVDMAMLDKLANAFKGENAPAGVKYVKTTVLSVRTGK